MRVFPPGVLAVFAAIAALPGVETMVPKTPSAPVPPAAAIAGPASVAVDFVSLNPIELEPGQNGATTTVLIRNDSAVAAKATLHLTLIDHAGNALATSPLAADLGALKATAVTIKVDSKFPGRLDPRLPARGVVMMHAVPEVPPKIAEGASPPVPAVKTRELVIPQIQPSQYEVRVTAMGLLAALVVVLVGVGSSVKASVSSPLDGSPAWTAQSWSSNLAIGGALLTSIVAVSALPAHTYFAAKANYNVLSTFYVALIAAAPAIYGLLKAGGTPSPQSAVLLFSVAAAVTVWATVGQLGMAAMLFLELRESGALNAPAAQAAMYLAAVMAVLVLIHAIRAVWFYATVSVTPVQAPGGGPVPPPGAGGARSWPLL